jgi:hypothetical protein
MYSSPPAPLVVNFNAKVIVAHGRFSVPRLYIIERCRRSRRTTREHFPSVRTYMYITLVYPPAVLSPSTTGGHSVAWCAAGRLVLRCSALENSRVHPLLLRPPPTSALQLRFVYCTSIINHCVFIHTSRSERCPSVTMHTKRLNFILKRRTFSSDGFFFSQHITQFYRLP